MEIPEEPRADIGETEDSLSQGEKMFQKMDDVEMVLRFFAYRHLSQRVMGLNTISSFLDRFLVEGNKFPSALLSEYRKIFEATTSFLWEILKEDAFRRIGKSRERPTKIIYDPLMWVASQYVAGSARAALLKKPDVLRERLGAMYPEQGDILAGAARTPITCRNVIITWKRRSRRPSRSPGVDDTMRSTLDEVLATLGNLESYVQSIHPVNAALAGMADPVVRGYLTVRRPIDGAAFIVVLYAAFEKFVEDLVWAHTELESAAVRYDELAATLQTKHLTQSASLLASKARLEYANLTVPAVIATLHHCVSGTRPYKRTGTQFSTMRATSGRRR